MRPLRWTEPLRNSGRVGSSRHRTLIALAVAAIAGTGAGIAIGIAEDDDTEPNAGSAAPSAPAELDRPEDRSGKPPEREPEVPPLENDPEGAEPGPSGRPPESADEQAAASAARGYVQGLDRRSGAAVCRSFTPGALGAVDLPEERGSCPASVKASLGFAKRGFPVWQHSQMTDEVSVEVSGDSAKVVATIFTIYADVREPTIEDDIIYLERDGDRWLVAKPSLTLHRAIGDADPPLSSLTPP